MKIHFNLVSQQIYDFDLPAVDPADFLKRLRAKDIFNRPLHQILGKVIMVSINPQAIEWVEVETDGAEGETSALKGVTLRQLSAQDFKQGVARHKEAIMASMDSPAGTRNILLAYGQAVFKSGRSLHFEVQAKMEREDDRQRVSQKIFGLPALFVRGDDERLFVVNPANIAVWQVVPGLKESSHFSVHGELKGVRNPG